MRKIILVGLVLLLAWPSVAQSSDIETYTSSDGVLQVSYMSDWRFGAIEPDLEVFVREARRREAPEAYRLKLFGSGPDAEIQFYMIDMERFIDEDEDSLSHFQSRIEALDPDMTLQAFTLGEMEVLEPDLSELSSQNIGIGGVIIDLSEARRTLFMAGRDNWLIVTVLIDESESRDEDFLTIVESFRFYGSSRNILSLSAEISLDVPEAWFRYQNKLDSEKEWESLLVHGTPYTEYCAAFIEIIDLDSPAFEFPEAGSPDDYLEAFLNGQENNYEPLDIYAEHLAEGVYLYMMENGEDYRYLSVQVLEEHLVISAINLGEGYCIDDYFLLINSVREE